ncbi:MAG: ATP-dependent endonuclease [Nitrosopumilus sp.]|nr:ATP-dependent endonuclease [Nitrosopumilus sp.]
MWIKSVRIMNFKAIEDRRITFEKDMTVMIGANGTGKTTVLHAIRAFFLKDVSQYDFNSPEKPIHIEIVFCDDESDDNTRTLSRIFTKTDGPKPISQLMENDKKLPAKFDLDSELKIKPIMINAMSDPSSELTDKKNTTLNDVVEFIRDTGSASGARLKLMQRIERHQKKLQIMNKKALDKTVDAANMRIGRISDDTHVSIQQQDHDSFDYKADVTITERGHETPVGDAGHGSQKLVLFSLIDAHAKSMENKSSGGSKKPAYSYILMFDEPDVYQSPSRSRSFYNSLHELSKNKRQQVICVTHSERFISMKDVYGIRLFRRDKHGKSQPVISHVDRAYINSQFRTPKEAKKTLAVLNVLRDYRFGLFSDLVVLVEGDGDRVLLETISELKNKKSFEAQGIQIVVCGGKRNIPFALKLYEKLDVPVYVIWEEDSCLSQQQAKVDNDRLNKEIHDRLGISGDDLSYKDGSVVSDKYACFENRVEDVMYTKGTSVKNDVYLAIKFIEENYNKDNMSAFRDIVDRIVAYYSRINP